MDYLDQVAQFTASLRFGSLPPEVVERARLVLLDSLGVMLAGSQEVHVRAMTESIRRRGSSGRSTVVVDGQCADAADAALLNAVGACVHVLDEGHKYARGHVATYVLPSVLAVAEEQAASGAELLTALVAGYEVAARMGMACQVRESMHPSGTWGTIGAVAAVARLLGMGPTAIRNAMNVAAPLTLATSWQAAVEGATVRDLYSGYGAANGVWAARWAQAGVTGSHDGVGAVFGTVCSEHFDPTQVHDALGRRWEILRNYFKVHACCRNFQAGIDVAITLKQAHAFKPEQITSVLAETFAIPARDNANREPLNVLAAKESFPVSLVLTLLHGRCDQSVFNERMVFDPAVRRLSHRVKVTAAPDLDALAPEQRPVRLTVELADGRRLTGYAPVALGDPTLPISRPDLEKKFRAAAAASLGEATARSLESAVGRVESLPAVGELMQSLRRVRADT